GVATSLLSKELKPAYVQGIREEYAKVRERTANRGAKTDYLTYQQAIDNRLQLDWSNYQAPAPTFTGTKLLNNIDLNVLREYIDWTPFFISWNLVGKYPRIFQDEVVGEAAQNLFDEAQALLDKMINEKLIEARATFAFWSANQVNQDDIELYDESGESYAMSNNVG